MKTITLNKIRKYIKQKNYEEALKLIEIVEGENILCPELLILKARVLLLCDFGEYSISDIEKMYKNALSINDNNIDTLMELGYFYYAIMDNNELANSYFKKAIKKCKKQMTEIVIGLAKSIEENSNQDALKFLETANSQTLEQFKINNLIKELKS